MLFTGYRNPDGYGRINTESGVRNAHRVAWELAYGPVPAGLEVCHTCDNRACCYIGHLFLGTHAANVRDMVAKGRRARPAGEFKPGSQHRGSKLTEADVLAIRREFMERPRRGLRAYFARKFSVCPATISHAVNGKNWRGV